MESSGSVGVRFGSIFPSLVCVSVCLEHVANAVDAVKPLMLGLILVLVLKDGTP